MMRSLFSGVSGLRSHQTKMDVIGNNISNVNTVGFKSSRVTFSEALSQTIQMASRANPDSGRGGVNPKQIGLGVNVGSIDVMMTEGANQRTDWGLDIKINGDGFFILGDATSNYFSRAGNFTLDEFGQLLGANGLHVMGWPAIASKTEPGQQEILKGTVQPLIITSGENLYSSPEATSYIKFEGNLDPRQTTAIKKNMAFFDSLGNEYTVGVSFEYNVDNKVWDLLMDNYMVMNGDTDHPIDLALTSDESGLEGDIGSNPSEGAGTQYIMSFQFNGVGLVPKIASVDTDGTVTIDEESAPLKLTWRFPKNPDTGSTIGLPMNAILNDITIDLSLMTGYSNNTTVYAEAVDGYTAGTLTGYNIGQDGIIRGKYSNGDEKLLGQIAIARFKNPAGLAKLGDNIYDWTPNSGDFDGVGEECYASGGSLSSGFLEMSNVDLSMEFTEMITTQRGFQANSRVITTSDEMLQELVSLKR